MGCGFEPREGNRDGRAPDTRAFFTALALAGCAQETTGEAGAPYAPYSKEINGNMYDSGGEEAR